MATKVPRGLGCSPLQYGLSQCAIFRQLEPLELACYLPGVVRSASIR